MKETILYFIITLCVAGVLFSCVSEDEIPLSGTSSIGDFEVTMPGGGANSKFAGTTMTISNDTVYLSIPYYYPEDSDNEVDLSNLILRLPVSSGAKIEPVFGNIMDVTGPLHFDVIAQDGSKKSYVLVVKKRGNLDIRSAVIEYETAQGNLVTKTASISNDTVIFLVNYELNDISRVKLNYDINKHSTGSIANGSEIDLSNRIDFKITGPDKSQRTYVLEVRMPRLLQYGVGEIQLLWKKTAKEMQNFPEDARSVIVSGDYLILVDGSKTGVPYLLYDRMTGKYVKELPNLPSPGIRTMTMANDSLGHFILSSWSGGAGNYKVYRYRDVNDTPELLIDWTVDDGQGIGRRLNIYGDLTKDAEIVATSGGFSNNIRRWIIRNGTLENNTPEKFTYASNNVFWDGTEVQPVEVSTPNKKSNYFISLFGVDGVGDGDRGIHWVDGQTNTSSTLFKAYPSLNGIAQISLEYISFNNAKYLANIKYSNHSWQNAYESVEATMCLFDVTNKGYYSFTPDNRLFNKFLIFTSPDKISVMPDNDPRNARGNADICYCFSDDGNTMFIYMLLTDGGIMAYQFSRYSS